MYHFIYPSKDAYIYELNRNSEKNFGGDDNLVLKKEFDGSTGLKGVSRVLLQFDLTELSQSLVSNEITTSLDGNSIPPRYYLRLYENKTSELQPSYSLATFPLSQSWEDGTGYTTQDPNSRDGVSWERTNESFDNTNWVTSLSNELLDDPTFDAADSWNISAGNGNLTIQGDGKLTADNAHDTQLAEKTGSLTSGERYQVSFTIDSWVDGNIYGINHSAGFTITPTGTGTYTGSFTATGTTFNIKVAPNASFTATDVSLRELSSDSGSRSTGGGSWYTSHAKCSQSFSYESPDVNMDITDMVNNWLDGTTVNNGLILKWSGSQEDSSTETGNINFFSSNANSIYSPKIEVRWDEHTNDYTGTIGDYDEEFNESGGSFEYPDIPIEPITIDGTDDNYIFMIGLRKTYKETEKSRFRVAGRERYQTKTVTTTKTTQKNKLIPQGSGSYSIIDVETGETLIPFGDYSKLSTDNYSNYFKLKLDGFINNRLYRILLRLKLNDGRYRIFDNNFDFKVVS
tara:strand:- start:105 stop:1646 length:1542 start_codon:yes stop_codon:yes gene_type:complete